MVEEGIIEGGIVEERIIEEGIINHVEVFSKEAILNKEENFNINKVKKKRKIFML